MRRVLFHPIADREQDEIYRWSVAQWDRSQADIYIRGLHRHLEQLVEAPGIWRPLATRLSLRLATDHQIFVSRYKMHYVFFRQLPGEHLGMLRLIHVRREMPRKLQRELVRITRDPIS